MSQDVKRWEPCLKDSPAGTYVTTRETKRVRNVYVTIEDHDRIMAERDELWKRATKFVMPGEMDTGESIEHYIKTLEQTIARQAKAIEKLRISMATALELESCGETSCPIPMRAMCSTPSHKELRKTLLEITAIEQGEGT